MRKGVGEMAQWYTNFIHMSTRVQFPINHAGWTWWPEKSQGSGQDNREFPEQAG